MEALYCIVLCYMLLSIVKLQKSYCLALAEVPGKKKNNGNISLKQTKSLKEFLKKHILCLITKSSLSLNVYLYIHTHVVYIHSM